MLIDLDTGIPPTPPEPLRHALLVGFTRSRLDGRAAAFASELDLTLAPAGEDRCVVVVPDVDAAIDGLASSVGVAPLAAATIPAVLRLTSSTTLLEG